MSGWGQRLSAPGGVVGVLRAKGVHASENTVEFRPEDIGDIGAGRSGAASSSGSPWRCGCRAAISRSVDEMLSRTFSTAIAAGLSSSAFTHRSTITATIVQICLRAKLTGKSSGLEYSSTSIFAVQRNTTQIARMQKAAVPEVAVWIWDKRSRKSYIEHYPNEASPLFQLLQFPVNLAEDDTVWYLCDNEMLQAGQEEFAFLQALDIPSEVGYSLLKLRLALEGTYPKNSL